MHLVLVLIPRARAVLRAVGTAVLLAAALAACAKSGPAGSSAGPGAPSLTAVVNGRYVTTVELGRGALLIAPPPAGVRATFSQAKAWNAFQTADVTEGHYSFAILGLALATLLPGPSPQAPTSTTTVPPTTTNARGSATSSSTTSAPTTTTTVSPSTTTATSPTTTTTAPPPLPVYDHRLAWVGVAFGGPACPASARSSGGSGSSTQVAVLIDASNGHDVLAFTGDTGLSCGAPSGAPTVVRPNQLVSVPWQPVGPASTAVQATVPACGQYIGWTQAAGPTSQSAVEVVASVPFDPLCGSSAPQVTTVDDVIPLGSSPPQLAHASLGPVQALRVLPGGTVGDPEPRGP